jgi:hypothetical protein
MRHYAINFCGIALRGEYGNFRLLSEASFLMVPFLFVCREHFSTVAATVLRPSSAAPPLWLRRKDGLLDDWHAHPDVELPAQVAEAGVHLLVLAILMALQGLALAIATVTLATGEPGRMMCELLAERPLSNSTSRGSTRGLHLLISLSRSIGSSNR